MTKRCFANVIICRSQNQVQPDMEELTDNAEEHDEEGSKQSEQKLGKLQYKVIRELSINRYQLVTKCIFSFSFYVATVGIRFQFQQFSGHGH